jgi:glucose/arabinose dehydrogenase
MRFSIDGGALHDFYNGAGINSDNGVLLNGVHGHAVHWTAPNSFDLFALSAGSHQVRLALVDQNNQELPGASTIHNFNVQQPPTGALQLQPVLSGLNFPVGLSLAPDGRIFFNERLTGKIRIINSPWQLDPTPFCQISVSTSGEQGLLGLTLDPNFASNQLVYVYYTVPGPTMNRVSRFSKSGGVCTETVILDNLPASSNHNGGIIKFGPDGMLYVVIGDAENPSNAQDKTSLAGKILRVNPANGLGLSDNPFLGSGNVNQDRVFSYGHRNSFGFTFHPQTGNLWESENGLSDFDEVNRLTRGSNYGWDSGLQSGFLNRPCCVNPIAAFSPVIAPTGIIAIPGNSLIYPPVYRNNLLMAAWIDGTIRLVIPNGTNPDQPGSTSVAYTGGQGGLLSFMLGSDGYIYVSSGDGIFRVVPH